MKQIFESENIRFVEVSERLIEDYLIMVNDHAHVGRFIGPAHAPFTAAQETEWVRTKLAQHALVFSMLEKTGGAFIGNIELMDVHDGIGELGIALTAKQQDKGYGTEGIRALIAYGFGRLDLNRIFLRTNPKNARAIHVYEKCGFREYDRTADHVFMELPKQYLTRGEQDSWIP